MAVLASALAVVSVLAAPAFAAWTVDITETRETFWSGAMFGGIVSICSAHQGGGLVDGAAAVLLESVMESTTEKYRYKSSGSSVWNSYRDGLKSEYPNCPIPSAK